MFAVIQSLIEFSLLATITSSLSKHPHQIAYFNEGAGGPENGYKHLLHSSLDWGQDLLAAFQWIKDEQIDEQVYIACKSQYGPNFLNPRVYTACYGPASDSVQARPYLLPGGQVPPPGTYLISKNFLSGDTWKLRRGSYQSFCEREPTGFIGYTFVAYHVTTSDSSYDKK